MSGRSRLRFQRIALLAGVAAIHVLVIRELFWQPFLTDLIETPQKSSVSWIALPPPAPEPSTPLPSFAPPSFALPFPNVIVEPAAPAAPPIEPRSSLAPPVTSTTPPVSPDSAVLGTLGQSLACNLANYEKLSPEEKERCLKRLAKLKDEPASAYVASDGEKRLAQQFARELAIKQAPPLLPCFSSVGLGVSVYPCLIRGVLNGFDFSDAPSYADAQTTDK